MPELTDKAAAMTELLNHAKHGERSPTISAAAYEWRERLIERITAVVIDDGDYDDQSVVSDIKQPQEQPQPKPKAKPSSIIITKHEAIGIDTTSVKIDWTPSVPADGFVEYGKTQSLGTKTTKEHKLLPRHRQMIRGLEPSSTYYYRINSTDGNGNTIFQEGTFQTDGKASGTKPTQTDNASTATSILNQWDNPPFYSRTFKPARTIKIDSQGDADAKYKQGEIRGGDVVQVARGLDVVINSPDFHNATSTENNPIHIEAYGSGDRPIFRGTGSREKKGGKGAAYYRVVAWRSSHHVNYDGIRFTGATNHGVTIGDRDGKDPAACSHFIFNDCEIDNVGHGGFRAAFGSNNIKMIGGSVHHIGILPESVSNKKGAGVGEPGYIGKGGGDGYMQKWAANNVEFINVHMHDCLGELDLKRHSNQITYTGCLLENFKLWSQGAITAGLNPRHDAAYKDYDVALLIDRCVIRLMVSRRSESASEPYGVCIGAGNAKIRHSIVDLVHGDAVHAYQDGHNSVNKSLDIENCILIARNNGSRSIETRGSRSSTNKTDAPLTVKAINNVVTTPTLNAAQVAGETVIAEDQLHTMFAGSQSDFANRGKLSAREHVELFLPG